MRTKGEKRGRKLTAAERALLKRWQEAMYNAMVGQSPQPASRLY